MNVIVFLKFPIMEWDFLIDQRNARQMVILYEIDPKTTKQMKKRLKRESSEIDSTKILKPILDTNVDIDTLSSTSSKSDSSDNTETNSAPVISNSSTQNRSDLNNFVSVSSRCSIGDIPFCRCWFFRWK